MDIFTLTPAEMPHAITLIKVCIVFVVLAIAVAIFER
jgi:hypothetical protein